MDFIQHLLPSIACVCYLLAAFLYVRELFVQTEGSSTAGRTYLKLGFVSHLLFLLLLSFTGVESASFPLTLSLISAIAIGLFLLLEKKYPISSLGGFLAPLATLFMFSSSLLFHRPGEGGEVEQSGVLLWTHVSSALFGHVLFLFAFGVSIALILQEALLRRKKLTLMQRRLPSLLFLDNLNLSMLGTGFFFMAFAVVAGIIFALTSKTDFHLYDPRLLWSALTLSIYAFVLSLRVIRGVRGGQAAWFSIVGYLTVVASFFGMQFLGGSFHVY